MLHGHPIAALALIVLGLLLLPLSLILVAATFYLTAIVMTIALAGGGEHDERRNGDERAQAGPNRMMLHEATSLQAH